MTKNLKKEELDKNSLLINDFKDFRDFFNNKEYEKPESILTIICGLAINMCKKTNANSLSLKSKISGINEDDFLDADIEILVKNIRYKKPNGQTP